MTKKTAYPLEDHQDFRTELSALLRKYNARIVSVHDEDLSVAFTGEDCVPLNQRDYGYAGADDIGAKESSPAGNPGVTIPDLPAKSGKKLALAHKVARCVVEHMNRNDPETLHYVSVVVRHHGNKSTGFDVSVTEGGFVFPRTFKSGSKIVEAVAQYLSKVSRIDSVEVQARAFDVLGKFVP